MDSTGIRAVFMQPDPSLAESEFHDWYNNEHGPLRLQLPFVHRGSRFRATDGQAPSWLAIYDLDHVNKLRDPSYLEMRGSQSEREVRVLNRIPTQERKAGRLISTKGSTSDDASVLVWVEMSLNDFKDEEEIFSLLRNHERRKLQHYYELAPAPRDLLHLPANETLIDTHFAHDGYRLHYRLEGSPDDSSPVVVFCNGLNTDLHLWDPTIELLKQRAPGFRFLRYDTRGYRFEGCHRELTLDVVSSDIEALLNALLIKKAHALIGVSMGGITAVAFASRYPMRLQKLIACDFNILSSAASVEVWKERIQIAKSEGMEVLAKQSVERWSAPHNRESPEWNRAISMVAAASVEGFEHSANVFYDFDETENMKKISIPSLYVVGAHDGNNVEAMKKFVGTNAPDAKLVEIEGAGHLPMVEKPSEFVDIIDSFLRT
ncbi:3-oxoadipate enol-lactonase, partial [Lecanoromycetidae sp. Uapishka_2]